ncbi:MAG: hypothetical protein AB7P03_08425 [Kofleriaceae bacterium]
MRSSVFGWCVLAGSSGCAYQPGSFVASGQPFVGMHMTVECLDVAIDRRDDIAQSPVLAFEFGNRCDRPATVDFASVVVIGRGADGHEHRLTPYDPGHEIAALAVDGRRWGTEVIAYRGPDVRSQIDQVCVDVASLTQQAPARWLCVGSVGGDQLAQQEAAQ